MLTKPDLKDEKIIACLHDNYGLDVAEISFLPLGADFNTAVYRVATTDKTDYFLKLRSGDFCEPSVLVKSRRFLQILPWNMPGKALKIHSFKPHQQQAAKTTCHTNGDEEGRRYIERTLNNKTPVPSFLPRFLR